MSNNIVDVNVTQTIAPTPNTLQQTGAFISQGATTTAAGTKSLLTQLADLTPILTGAKAISTMLLSAGTVTVTTTSPHGFTVSDTIPLTIAGVTPSAYNGTYTCTITGASTFTYALGGSPGSVTVQGVYTPEDVAELLAMATTYFAQGSVRVGVYVLELGAGNATDGATYLGTWITANPGIFYAYLVPRTWDGNSAFLALIASYDSPTSKTYFFVTTTTGTYTDYTALMKSVVTLIEAAGIPATEFSLAAFFKVVLNTRPSSSNKVAPFSFRYVFGVTPYPIVGNAALRQTLKTAGVNLIFTGAEGGISNTAIYWGTTMDVRPFNYWYAVDWAQITGAQNVANEVINGSNNPINPLYYNQQGINRLQAVLARTMTSGVTFGMVLGTVVQTALFGTDLSDAFDSGTFAGKCDVNAIPFAPYASANPSDYKAGVYDGLSITFTPLRGFESITFNINVTDFVAQ